MAVTGDILLILPSIIDIIGNFTFEIVELNSEIITRLDIQSALSIVLRN